MRRMDAVGYFDFYEPSILPDGSRLLHFEAPARLKVFMIVQEKRSVT